MKKAFFSIVIPTLNEEQFLPRLLTCLTKQTFKDFEVIVSDGKSHDRTKEKALEFRSQLTRFHFYTGTKASLSYQRNFGAKYATGIYLVFFDADAQIDSTFLDRMHGVITTTHHPFLTTYLIPDSINWFDRLIMWVANHIFQYGTMIGIPFAVGGNITIEHNTFIKVGGFDEHVVYAEDYMFSQKMKRMGVKPMILKHPKLIFSFRRYRREGRARVLFKFVWATLYLWIFGPITHDLFSYQMGGGQYKKKG